jgi:hypothetical protein
VKRRLKPLLKKLGLKGGLHAFRHGNATAQDRLHRRHGDPITVSGKIGEVVHSYVSIENSELVDASPTAG